METTIKQAIEGKRVLVIGIGGGCDVISAYALCEHFKKNYGPSTICYGNTISPRDLSGTEKITDYIYKFSEATEIITIAPKQNTYHTIVIEQSLPRDTHGSPFLFVLPSEGGESIESVTQKNKDLLGNTIKTFSGQWDTIIGVDGGGDSLTGGIDFKKHPAFGRDRQMLTVLSSLGVNFFHMIIGPCCDGESTHFQMNDFVTRAGEYHLGSFQVNETMATVMQDLSKTMAVTRTTNLISAAFFGDLDELQDNRGNVQINRGIKPWIPLKWLTDILVFQWPHAMDPCLLFEDDLPE